MILNRLADWKAGPEKAGVGGSIPSLATTLESIIYEIQVMTCDAIRLSGESGKYFIFNIMWPFDALASKRLASLVVQRYPSHSVRPI
jgi:hypothetical protein